MGRIRSIKPELLDDEKAQNLSHAAWRLFVSMWLLADDYGALRASQKYLSCQVFQDMTVDTDELLQTLEKNGMVKLYQVKGEKYLIINSWDKHQRIQRKGRRRVPVPESLQEVADNTHKDVENCLTEFSPTNIKTKIGKGIGIGIGIGTEGKDQGKLTLSNPDTCGADNHAVDHVWDYYLHAKRGRGRTPKLTDKRRGQIKSRLKEFKLDEIKDAIERLFEPGSFWLNNGYTRPEYIFRSTEQVEKLLDQPCTSYTGVGSPPKLDPDRGLRVKHGALPGDSSE